MVLITGAYEFVGRHIARALRTRRPGNSIRVLAHSQQPAGVLPDDVQVSCGDLRDTEFLAEVAQEAEMVIHLAAKIRPDPRRAGNEASECGVHTQSLFRCHCGGVQVLFARQQRRSLRASSWC
jgi:nucleoside-diphosphate-sugar epimerase